jgi:hypothetical protein
MAHGIGSVVPFRLWGPENAAPNAVPQSGPEAGQTTNQESFMRKIILAACALAALMVLPGCGDNGPLPTLLGAIQRDYVVQAPDSWQDAAGDPLSLLMASFMAEGYVVEHLFMPAGSEPGGPVTTAMVLVDRSGPSTPAEIEAQCRDYLARPLSHAPDAVRHTLDPEAGWFRVEERAGAVLTILERRYTRKGYVAVLAACPAEDDDRRADIEAVIRSVNISPDIAYRDGSGKK